MSKLRFITIFCVIISLISCAVFGVSASDDEEYYEDDYYWDENLEDEYAEDDYVEEDYFEDGYFEDSYFGDNSYYETSYSQFVDVSYGDYYYDAVNWAVQEEVTSGTTEKTFSPNLTCTRGQVVTFLWRALGNPAPKMNENIFTDVSGDAYYYNAVLWAYENQVTSGTTATTFSPEDTCTSGQVITFLWRALGEPDGDVSLLPESEQAQYYAKAVAWAEKNNLLNYSTTKFRADNLSPRADIVTYLYYALK